LPNKILLGDAALSPAPTTLSYAEVWEFENNFRSQNHILRANFGSA